MANDLDSIQVSLSVAGDDDGAGVLPARLTADIVRSLDAGAVAVDVSSDEARIASGRSQFTVRTLAVEDYPKISEPAPHEVRLPAASFGTLSGQLPALTSRDRCSPACC
jgi:DNA polymerase-3 subunit beta